MSNIFTADAAPFDPYVTPTGQQLQTAYPTDIAIEGCGPGRREEIRRIKYRGKMYTVIARDKLIPEDWLLNQVKAAAAARRELRPYAGVPPERSFRDVLVIVNLET